jgi:alkanesulfonate monooxygenase SsuD/methylene tetrahydromethanopterin reductase-like flavin-dependent oxidoreductase (luciferase family)
MRFDFGMFTCQIPPGTGSISDRYQELLDLAPVAEEAGFEKFWTSEHHFVDDGYNPSVLPFSAALGARTDQVRIGTGIALAPFYDPIRFAEDCAVIDTMTGGRFEPGLAIGWTDEEFEVFGVEKQARVQYLKELIEVCRNAWGDEAFSYDGAIRKYDGVDVHPKPVQEHVPIWIGVTVDAAVERAGQIADGYMATPTDLDELARRQSLGRETADKSFELAEWRYTYVSEDGNAWEEMKQHAWYIKKGYIEWATGEPQPTKLPADQEKELRAECLVGTPDEVRDQLRERGNRLGDDYRIVARMTLPGLCANAIHKSMKLFSNEVIGEV